jgi:hypothetical protein
MSKNTNELLKTIDRWEKIACDQLLGKKIVKVRYLGVNDLKNLGWSDSSVAFQLDDGNWIFASRDDEGNGAGSFFTSNEENPVLPTIYFGDVENA